MPEASSPKSLAPRLTTRLTAHGQQAVPEILLLCRYTYLLKEPPSPAALAAIQAAGAALLLSLVNAVRTKSSQKPTGELNWAGSTNSLQDGKAWLLEVNSPLRAGAELGLWTFAANAATISAFQSTPASRGAFLLRFIICQDSNQTAKSS